MRPRIAPIEAVVTTEVTRMRRMDMRMLTMVFMLSPGIKSCFFSNRLMS